MLINSKGAQKRNKLSLLEEIALLNSQLVSREETRMSLPSSESVNTDMDNICYKGEKKQEWTDSVAALNNLHTTVYPKILDQDINGQLPVDRRAEQSSARSSGSGSVLSAEYPDIEN